MIALQILPIALSLIVLGAHFLRAGNSVMLVIVLALLALLPVRRWWAARTVQAGLVVGALEWTRTLVGLARLRAEAGEPATRLVLILGGVALWTGLSAFLFQTTRLRTWFRLLTEPAEPQEEPPVEKASPPST